MTTVKLNPSDFAFLYENCKRCFYLKSIKDVKLPYQPMAAIFNKIDAQEKEAFANTLLSEVADGFPEGKIVESDKWTISTYVTYPELDYRHFIKGKLDSLMKMQDGTYQIIDFKTSDTKEHSKLYTRQLHSYAYALENPMYDYSKLDAPISGIGLMIWNPDKGFSVNNNGDGLLKGTFTWKQLPYTPEKFIQFMDKITNLLTNKEMPEPSPECTYCKRDLIMMDWDNYEITKKKEEEKDEEDEFKPARI